jgi:hypothetical protein
MSKNSISGQDQNSKLYFSARKDFPSPSPTITVVDLTKVHTKLTVKVKQINMIGNRIQLGTVKAVNETRDRKIEA